MFQLLSGIQYCHSMGIIHRDLKFQNILLARSPNKESQDSGSSSKSDEIDLKIVDFGIFGTARGNQGEKSNVGSLKYMPPEVLIGFNEATPKIDIWSLGIILHGLVLGYLPFSSSNKDDLRK